MFLTSFSCRLKNVLYVERNLFSSAIYVNIKRLREENGIDEFIITINRTLKRKIMDTFPEEISFHPNGKYLIVQSSTIYLL